MKAKKTGKKLKSSKEPKKMKEPTVKYLLRVSPEEWAMISEGASAAGLKKKQWILQACQAGKDGKSNGPRLRDEELYLLWKITLLLDNDKYPSLRQDALETALLFAARNPSGAKAIRKDLKAILSGIYAEWDRY